MRLFRGVIFAMSAGHSREVRRASQAYTETASGLVDKPLRARSSTVPAPTATWLPATMRSSSGLTGDANTCSAQPNTPVPLGETYRNVKPVKTFSLGSGCGQLVISRGSVVNFDGDAIVNAANEGCQGGGGVDGAITSAGGEDLAKARRELPIVEGSKRCLVGDAVMTTGGDLKSNYCIHAVGPNYRHFASEEEADKKLASAYASAMLLGRKNRLRTIGFSLLSSGIFRGGRSLDGVLQIAVQAVAENSYVGLEEVHLCAFTEKEVDTLVDVAQLSNLDGMDCS
mmetsp:Transcript_14768/g.24036  ORF Transcript_14768/g.24036 Transcript_14768/m.24036 type:complete len:284 (-) Transcript_14768:1435-2286(-)